MYVHGECDTYTQMLPTVALVAGGFEFISPDCSWYEHHMMGGCIRPTERAECQTERQPEGEHHLGVIIPFRGSVESGSFNKLCTHIPQHLRRSGISFNLLVVNQVDDHPFNRAALANAGFSILAGRTGARWVRRRPDYLTIHDVDRYPTLPGEPAECDAITARYYDFPAPRPRVLHPTSYTGGVLLISTALYEKVNGFSNQFWGWGHEDNDLYCRLRWCGLKPDHGAELDRCMLHRDCVLCKAEKEKSATTGALLHETLSIALLQQHLKDPWASIQTDGLSQLNFTTRGRRRGRKLPCGNTSLRVVDVRLVRDLNRERPLEAACTAEKGCGEPVSVEAIPSGLVEQAARRLPKRTKLLKVVSASHARVLYNYNWELDVLTEHQSSNKEKMYRLAFCAQVWQPRSVPDETRYRPLWRAARSKSGVQFKRTQNFTYEGDFPCHRLRQMHV